MRRMGYCVILGFINKGPGGPPALLRYYTLFITFLLIFKLSTGSRWIHRLPAPAALAGLGKRYFRSPTRPAVSLCRVGIVYGHDVRPAIDNFVRSLPAIALVVYNKRYRLIMVGSFK
jgi:hypothetical protein